MVFPLNSERHADPFRRFSRVRNPAVPAKNRSGTKSPITAPWCTVDGDTLARTYRSVSPGVYMKTAPVWAELAERGGFIRTKEGVTHYEVGAYIVYNDLEDRDGYAVNADPFEEMYQPAPQGE